ncbi:glycosyltransferase family 2 protein [Microbulbifer sp. TRSA001]|uniref:glycosyltransferase family 2 protein n=1 Tax=Microbulbifer sp. TRSA001 TaxID=3243381 RepID=UPI00403A5C48
MNHIFKCALPKIGICSEEHLYLRRDPKATQYNYENSDILFLERSTISFDTYFNFFSSAKFKKYTDVKSLFLELKFSGEIVVELHDILEDNSKKLLKQISLNDDAKIIDISEAYVNSSNICFSITASKGSSFHTFSLLTHESPINEVELGIVVPTYKRESYVKKIARSIHQASLAHPRNKVETIIVDNGSTLDEFAEESVELIPNPNYGGAGGFARGLIRARELDKTHVLFCDDDITLDPIVISRIITIFEYAKDRKLSISGSMLRSDRPSMQHENGALLNDDYLFIPLKHNLDLNFSSNLKINDTETARDYAAWWCFAWPIKELSDAGYPNPIFFRWDDAEFSLRLKEKGASIIDFNGIGVWHDPFEHKYASSSNYYEERNCFLARSQRDKDFTYKKFLRRAKIKVFHHALMFRYETANMILDAYNHALEGESHFSEIRPDEFHQALLKSQTEKTGELPQNYNLMQSIHAPHYSTSRLKWLLAKLTLNGHLLPSAALRKGTSPTSPGTVFASTLEWQHPVLLRARKVVFVAGDGKNGFIAERSRRKFMLLIYRFALFSLKSRKKFLSAKENLKNSEKLNTKSFWLSYLDRAKD